MIRETIKSDVEYLAESCIKIVKCMRLKNYHDLYIDNFPNEVSSELLNWIKSFISTEYKFSFVYTENDIPAGCIFGEIEESVFPMCFQKPVGHITVLYVETNIQQSGIGKKLLTKAEDWLKLQGISLIETTYMTNNIIAKNFWSKGGYSPFRTHAYKKV
jgi:GNAT superfamily N-acetyltransferase